MRLFLNFITIFLLSLFIVNSVHADNSFKKIGQEFSDSFITTKITAKYTKDRDLNPLKISVSTQDGVVTLKGYVKNKPAFVKALRLAKRTKGVKTVDIEDLVIKQVNTSLTDAYITAKVEAAILKAKVFDDEAIPLVGINATTNNGVVTLSGKLKQKKSITMVIKRVNAVRGVKKIISKLRIHQTG